MWYTVSNSITSYSDKNEVTRVLKARLFVFSKKSGLHKSVFRDSFSYLGSFYQQKKSKCEVIFKIAKNRLFRRGIGFFQFSF